MPTLTSEAKQLLSKTVRELRELLLQGLRDSAEQRYRLSLPLAKAKLSEELRKKRERLEAWLEERQRSVEAKDGRAEADARSRFLDEALKEAAATLLNRLVLLRHLEALGLSKPAVVTGGWTSKGYQELREFAPALCGENRGVRGAARVGVRRAGARPARPLRRRGADAALPDSTRYPARGGAAAR